MKYNMHTARKGMKACFQIAEYCLSYANIAFLSEKNISFIEPTLKSKACFKYLYFTKIISDLCCYLEYFSYLYTINQTE